MAKKDIAKFAKALRKAKEKAEEAQEAENALFDILDAMGIDAQEIGTEAPNADNLQEAITCYLNYGEYTAEEILEELKEACNRGNDSLELN